jgi:hypothetical protein
MTAFSRILCIASILLTGAWVVSHGQVMNTGGTLSAGRFSITAAPVLFVRGGDPDLGVYLIGGAGLPRGIDLAINARFVQNDNRALIGGDFEWNVLSGLPTLSFTTGAHVYRDVGLDLALNLTFPIRSAASLYTGADLDIDFTRNGVRAPVWIVFGGEVAVRRSLGALLELDLLVHETGSYSHVFGAGMVVYF